MLASKATALALALLLAPALAGCDRPCEALEQRVCEQQPDKEACELLREPERREALTDETCERVLKKLSKR